MKPIQRLLPLVNAAMCVLLLLLLLADLLFPRADIFLSEVVKVFVLVTCIVSAVCGAMLYARQRRRSRKSRWVW